MHLKLLTLVTLLLCLSTPTLAQEPPEVPVAEAPSVEELAAERLLGQLPDTVQAEADAWAEAWHNTPRLVSLQGEDQEFEDQLEELRFRLKLLGEKTFSNREWKRYWAQQAELAGALATSMTAHGAPAEQIAGIEAWVALAEDKVVNQDAYFAAIESERDALEDRLEAALDAQPESDSAKVEEEAISDPNPYERRRMGLAALERRIDTQESKRLQVKSDISYIERLLESEAFLATALEKDLELAERELKIAQSQAGFEDAWGELWTEIAAVSSTKADKIGAEFDYGQARERERQVELGLAKSQVQFRDERLGELQAEYETAASVGSWLSATWDTSLLWLRLKAWKVALALVLLYFGIRLALRGNHRVAKFILERADDDPDVDDASDQRRETLADVFTSVARIAIYIVGGLVALEQIGINTGPILGSVAILGLAISFGSQNLVRDIVNGFFILLENQYAVGDVVTIGGKTGTVERINIRSTWLRSANGDLHAIPNGTISMVSNSTRDWSRSIIEIGVAYDVDLAKVEEVINRVGQEMFAEEEWAEVLEEAPAWVGVTNLGDSAVVVRTWVKVEPGSQWGVGRELNRRLKLAFDDAGIEIPFPQMVMHQPTS